MLVSMLARNLVVSSSSVFLFAAGRRAFSPFRCRENSVMESMLKPTLFRMVALFQFSYLPYEELMDHARKPI